jgi:hypothetical protein
MIIQLKISPGNGKLVVAIGIYSEQQRALAGRPENGGRLEGPGFSK